MVFKLLQHHMDGPVHLRLDSKNENGTKYLLGQVPTTKAYFEMSNKVQKGGHFNNEAYNYI